jgi:hypothetical protein
MPSRDRAQELVNEIEAVQKRVSNVRPNDNIILITAGDLHLTLTPPAFRSKEKDWLGRQAEYLQELEEVRAKHNCPIAYTGDIFDKWKVEPELINFALDCLPKGYAIAGNHDLPYHRLDQIKKSAYWTLVRSQKLEHVGPEGTFTESYDYKQRCLFLFGFSWGQEINTLPVLFDENFRVALVHAYCWQEGHSFPGCENDTHAAEWWDLLKDRANAAVFGDNHKGFLRRKLLNGGGFMRRRSDETSYKPFIGLLTDKGEWRQHFLNTSKDVCLEHSDDMDLVQAAGFNFNDFLEMLEDLGDSSLDFEAAVKEAMNKYKVRDAVRQIILRCLEGK